MTAYSTPRLSVFVRQMKSDEIVVTYNKFLLQVSFCPITYSNIQIVFNLFSYSAHWKWWVRLISHTILMLMTSSVTVFLHMTSKFLFSFKLFSVVCVSLFWTFSILLLSIGLQTESHSAPLSVQIREVLVKICTFLQVNGAWIICAYGLWIKGVSKYF